LKALAEIALAAIKHDEHGACGKVGDNESILRVSLLYWVFWVWELAHDS
jgi:hypothetical protein